MPTPSVEGRLVTATIDQILPRLGLAWAVDDEHMCFGLTGLARGVRTAPLVPGVRVQLIVAEHKGAQVVTAWSALDDPVHA